MHDGSRSAGEPSEADFNHILEAPLLAKPRVPVVIITREPFQWLLSMHREPHGLQWFVLSVVAAPAHAAPILYDRLCSRALL